MQNLQPALNILKPKTYIALIQFIEVVLGDPSPIVMQPDKEFVAAGILCQMDKARIAMLQDIVHQLLDHPEDNELIFRL